MSVRLSPSESRCRFHLFADHHSKWDLAPRRRPAILIWFRSSNYGSLRRLEGRSQTQNCPQNYYSLWPTKVWVIKRSAQKNGITRKTTGILLVNELWEMIFFVCGKKTFFSETMMMMVHKWRYSNFANITWFSPLSLSATKLRLRRLRGSLTSSCKLFYPLPISFVSFDWQHQFIAFSRQPTLVPFDCLFAFRQVSISMFATRRQQPELFSFPTEFFPLVSCSSPILVCTRLLCRDCELSVPKGRGFLPQR